MEGQISLTTAETDGFGTVTIDAFPGGASQDGMGFVNFIRVLGSCTCWLSNTASCFVVSWRKDRRGLKGNFRRWRGKGGVKG